MNTKPIRIFSLFLAVVMLLSLLPTAAIPASAQDATVTVYFKNNWKWSDVCIHYWNSADSSIDTTWPGIAMTLVETDTDGYDIYSAEVPAAATGIVFNGLKDNGSGSRDQTPDITTIETGVYYYMVWDNVTTYSTTPYTPPTGEDGNTCEHSYTSEVTAPTCTAKGYTTYTCSLCAYSYKGDYTEATGHSYGSNGVCSVCGDAPLTVFFDNVDNWDSPHAHYWGGSENTTWPGVAMTLVEGSIYRVTIPADTPNIVFTTASGSPQTADLTIPGNGYLYSNGTWSAYITCDHSWGEGEITTAATCTADGVRTYTCSLCGETKTETITASGHSYVDGSCSICGATVECAEHSWDEGVVTTEPGCWTFGSKTLTCTLCGATKTQSIAPGHDRYVAEIIAPTCIATGKEITKCTRCAYSYDRTLPKVDHTYVAGETVAPTCTEDGYTVYTCSVCGVTSNRDLVYHTGHVWSGNTCTTCGAICNHTYVSGICSGCHDGGPAYVEGYYEIANVAQLFWFADQVNSGNNAINGKLIADIDLMNCKWTSIGYYLSDTLEPDTMPYTGTFDGQGHTVSNFTTIGTDNEGLFGYCSSATIRNVGVVNATVTGWRAGAVAGYPLTSNVTNCFAKDCTIIGSTTNSVALSSGSVHIAPIASPQGGIIRNCYAVNCTLIGNTDLTVNTSPVGGTDTQNGYYCNTIYDGTFSSVRNSTEVTLEQLASGEVTYLLNKGITDGTQGWYQTCGTGMPAHSGLTVYQITNCAASTQTYTNDANATNIHNYENGICTGCGAAAPLTAPVIIPHHPTLSFKGEVFINVYYTIDNTDSVVEMGLATSADSVVDDTDTKVPGYEKSADGMYIVRTEGISAKNLGDTIYFRVYAKLTDGSVVYSENTYNYSALAYAKDRLANSTSAEMKALCVAMLNYGAAAQIHFGYNTDSLMNAGLTDEQKALVSDYSADMVAAVSAVDSAKIGEFAYNSAGYSKRYPSVSFQGAFAINYYFTPALAVDNGMTLYYWTQAAYDSAEVLTADNASGTITMELQETGEYLGIVSGISAKDIDATIFVAGVYESNGESYATGILPYSLGAYCVDRINKSTSATMVDFAKATAVYGYYAKEYFAI